MKAQTNEDNIIKDIFLTSGGTLGFPYDPMELQARSDRIINIYKHADTAANQTRQQLIDDVILLLCDRSLSDILRKYEGPEDL